MIRTIRVEENNKKHTKKCALKANHFLSPDMAEAMKCSRKE